MKYPRYRDELVALLEEDQREVRAQSHAWKCDPNSPGVVASGKRLTERCLSRAHRMLEILVEIGAPTIDNIGKTGSEALAVLALHSKYSIMKHVLAAFEQSYAREPANTFRELIPALTDRILIVERKKQRFGSQWLMEKDGTFFLYPVADFAHMNERRALYRLDKARHPRDLTYGIPKGPLPPYTQESDQRQPTPEEYDHYVSIMLD